MDVPFLDLKAQYAAIREEIGAELQRVLESAAFAGGPFVQRFEEEFAAFCQCKHAIGTGSGTEALWIALSGLGIGAGDEVITAPNSFIATAEAISLCGATPVFVDVDERTYLMEPGLIEAAITPRTKAIVPVHLFGQCADMDPILKVAAGHGLKVVEDACQAHGAQYKSRPAGSMGDAGCFSFYPGKNLGAYGEGGAITTNHADLAAYIQSFRDHGQCKKYYHDRIGWNGRMDGIQGAVLSVKLKHLPQWNAARRQHAKRYNALLEASEAMALPYEADYGKHVYHLYVIRNKARDALIEALHGKGIHCGIHYPVPIHLQDAYAPLGHPAGSFPVAERSAAEFVSLPMFAELSEAQIERVAEELRAHTTGKSRNPA